jgi:hypothetical protein
MQVMMDLHVCSAHEYCWQRPAVYLFTYMVLLDDLNVPLPYVLDELAYTHAAMYMTEMSSDGETNIL